MKESFRRAAFVVTPHAGGTFSVYLSLRAALEAHGIALEWVGHSAKADELRADAALAPYFAWGHLVDTRGMDRRQAGEALLKKTIEGGYGLVFVNVLTSLPEMSVAAHLPEDVKRVMIVHSITPGTYDAARAVGRYVHAAVGVCPRNRDHMVRVLKFPADRTFCVPNAVDVAPFRAAERMAKGELTRILFLGRIVDIDKGVFWLPGIMKRLEDLNCRLTVAGDGPDLAALKKRCDPLGQRVVFKGRVAPAAIPQLVAVHDVLLMPSRFEGFGFTLIEAMAGGCVPVASRIAGVTDFVLKEGETGLLFPVGDCALASDALRKLAGDENVRQQMAGAGRTDAEARFSIPAMGRAYGEVLAFLEKAPAPQETRVGQALELPRIRGSWRRMVPQGVKNVLRKWHYGRA